MKRVVAVLSLALALNLAMPQSALAADEYWEAWGDAFREQPVKAAIVVATPIFVVTTVFWGVRTLWRLQHRARTGEEL